MNAIRSLTLLACAGSLSCGAALADELENAEQADALSEIIVTATRVDKAVDGVPAAISVVSGDEIQIARQQLSLDEALARVPGVFFQNRFNFAQDLRIAIRGFGARSNFGVRGIKILIDGIPETLADGQSQVDSIDLASVRQVEVLRGPASALYGNAAGGVINILSERSSTEPYVDARMAIGDFGFQKYQVKTAASVGRLDLLVSLSDLRIDGYREHSEAENTQVNSRFRFRISDSTEIGWTISATDQPVSNDPGGLVQADATANPRGARDRNIEFDAGEALDQQKLGISIKHSFAGGGDFRARGYYLARDFRNRLPFTGGGIVTFDRAYSGGGISYSRRFELGGLTHRVVAGLDHDRQRDDRRRFDNDVGVQGDLALDQLERITSTGLFVQDEVAVSDRLEVTLGLRYDDIEFDVSDAFLSDGNDSGTRTIDDVSPSIGFLYNLGPRHAMYGSIATAFETPTSTEFANPDGGGGFNPGLEPQKSTNYELGLRGGLFEGARYEFAVFTIDVEDELIPFAIASSPDREFFANAGKSKRRGVELSLSAAPMPGLSVALAYTWSQFEFDAFVDDAGNDFSGNRIPGIPNTFAHADISYEHESGFFAAVDALYTGDLFADNANSTKVRGATIANLRLGLRKSLDKLDIEPFVGVGNVFDTDYSANVRINAFGGRYFEPGPDRNLYGGVSVRFRYAD
ncbi:MAG: TonB-dependent receptor [Woeseiaceae bacterium]|nr:TonB-dependent receptor [Woeseiaceae bacterium]